MIYINISTLRISIADSLSHRVMTYGTIFIWKSSIRRHQFHCFSRLFMFFCKTVLKIHKLELYFVRESDFNKVYSCYDVVTTHVVSEDMHQVDPGVLWCPCSLAVALICWEVHAATVTTCCCAGCRWWRLPWPSQSRRTITWANCWLKSRRRRKNSWSDGAERRRKNLRHVHIISSLYHFNGLAGFHPMESSAN